jgi:hypothetical protein
MLAAISLLTALAFAVLYPLCFWISASDPLKNNFHKFHIGLPNTVGGVVLIFVWVMDLPLSLKAAVTAWKVIFLSVSWYSWKKAYPDPRMMTFACAVGVYALIRTQAHWAAPGWTAGCAGVLSGLIFCAALYAMNLGHWYLNVHGLPMTHLKRATAVFWSLLGVRALWDVYFLLTGTVVYGGDEISLVHFMARIDGFLLVIGLFFGTFFPLAALYFVNEVLKLKNTQSVTGILYVILCSVLVGDIAYKYYLIKFGVAL